MTLQLNRQVTVAAHVDGIPRGDTFAISDTPVPLKPQGGVLVRVMAVSADPGMRGWVSREQNYMTIPVGQVMRASGIGEVLESDDPAWRPGDHVFGWFGWQAYAGVPAKDVLWKVDLEAAPASAWLGVLGLNGIAAWVGLLHHARPSVGETILVTTGAGGVGGVVGQLAAARGLRTICLTSSDEKAASARFKLGYTEAINYKGDGDLAAKIAAAAPDGIQIFYDNAAGWLADAVFPSLSLRARVIQCGTASVASWKPPPTGPRRERDVLTKRLSWTGFLVFDHADLFPLARRELLAAFQAGTLIGGEQILNGLEAAPDAIGMLYRSENTGKLVISV